MRVGAKREGAKTLEYEVRAATAHRPNGMRTNGNEEEDDAEHAAEFAFPGLGSQATDSR